MTLKLPTLTLGKCFTGSTYLTAPRTREKVVGDACHRFALFAAASSYALLGAFERMVTAKNWQASDGFTPLKALSQNQLSSSVALHSPTHIEVALYHFVGKLIETIDHISQTHTHISTCAAPGTSSVS